MKTTIITLAAVATLFASSISANAENLETSSEFNGEACTENVYRSSRVYSHDTDTWTVTLYGYEDYVIEVDGDGDTDLDLYVYDENGNCVGSDDDRLDYCVVRITPRWTGKFEIRIVNRGNVYNNYDLTIR